MDVAKIFGNAVSYIPVVRAVIDIITAVIKLSAGAVNEIQTQVEQIESIHRWLKDNDVNTFSEYYEKEFEKEN